MFSTSGMLWEATGELPAKTKIPRFARNDRDLGGALNARNGMAFRPG
jgi:hypothetical protein